MSESEKVHSEWLLKFDQFFFVELPKKKKNDKNSFTKVIKNVKEILVRAWDERIQDFDIYNAGVDSTTKKQRALVGVKLTADWDKPITKGPEANHPEAADFRSFWGNKSEMRKLLDGSIREAVIWYTEEEAATAKRKILVTIANHALAKHLSPQIQVQSRYFNWHFLVTHPSEYNHISIAFEKLADAIRGIKGFPLTVSTVYCTSPFYRKTEPCPPLGRYLFEKSKFSQLSDDNVARMTLGMEEKAYDEVIAKKSPYFTPALTVLLTMEHSNKFGETPETMSKFKTAFYIELAQRLKDDYGIFAVPTERNFYASINDVAFDVEIGQTKEIAIARRLENENKLSLIPPGGDWKTLKHKIEFLPQMSNQISGLSYRFPAFAETCQLFKRFTASHFLLEHFDDIAVELIVANVFLTHDLEYGSSPLDAFSGFIHVLHMLATHDFAKQPLFIDFNGNLDSERKEKLMTHFINARPVLPLLVLFTSDDDSGIRFTKNGPEVMLFSRLLEIASCALLVIKKHLEGIIDTDIKSIFSSQMDGFDLIIELNKDVVPFSISHYKYGKKQMEKLKPRKNDLLPIVNFNPPMKFLDELKVYFGKIALFFYDRYGGKEIGVIFRPEFKVNRTLHRKNTKDGLAPNFAEVIKTIQILGEGIVTNVNLNQIS